MPVRPQPVFDLTPLHRPLWWAALALLLVNDNLLKGGGVAPGWLTGKLSDLAFLIVAPVLLAALLPRAVAWRRGIALGAVALVYAAADLSPAVSQAIVATAHRIGLPWRLWPDAGDLVALVVLPLTWWLMRPADAPPVTPGSPTRARPLLESAGVFVGAFACLATSAPPDFAHAPFAVNQTAQPREVTATWLLRTVPCDGDLASVAATLNPNDLDDPHSATIASGDVVVLDASPPPGQPLSSQCPIDRYGWYGSYGACTGVILQVSSELTVLAAFPVGWREYEGGFVCSDNDNAKSQCKAHFGLKEDPGPDALSLRERNGKLVLSVGVGSRVRIAEVSLAAITARPPGPQGCRALLVEQEKLSGAACTVDADCKTAPALPLPGRSCVIYGNRSLSDQATMDLRTRWNQQSCLVDPNSKNGCPAPQPATCRNERCQELCPGVQVPTCPVRCGSGIRQGNACYLDPVCAMNDGSWCSCQNGSFACAPPTTIPGCPILCVPPADPYAPPPPDARPADTGLPDVRPADTGLPDARPDTQVEAGN